MNYRHIYHAGNISDVVKHAVLTHLLRHLREKEKGFAVLDCFAGAGLYDRNDPRAQKTGEAAEGILNLLAAPALPALADFYAVLRKVNPLWSGEGAEGFRVYPGSPLFAFHLLREQDRLIACELHPEEEKALRVAVPADKRVQIHCRDGYEALGAFLPPPEKRGLALIDPPYERADEFDVIVKRVGAAYRRWSSGIFMIWYPVKDRPAIWKFHEGLAATGIRKILCAEFVYDEDVRADKLSGSGMIVINPPWKLDEELKALFPLLHGAMGTGYAGVAVRWLAE
jgi:23S rRNA (adenine2030-N6)-methyltransferase